MMRSLYLFSARIIWIVGLVAAAACGSEDNADVGTPTENGENDSDESSEVETGEVHEGSDDTQPESDMGSSDEASDKPDSSSELETDDANTDDPFSGTDDTGEGGDTEFDSVGLTGTDTESEMGTSGTNTDVDTEDSDPEDIETEDVDSEDTVHRECFYDCLDFPEAEMLESEISADEIVSFGDPESFEEPGPCIVEPQLSEGDLPGALFPADWIRPRFRFVPNGGEDLFEIRMQADREKFDLRAYTRNTTWIMPKEIWDGLTKTVLDEPITVTIRGISSKNPGVPSGSRGTFSIAPVKVGGKVIYFSAISSKVAPDSAALSAFIIGEEPGVDVLSVNDVGDRHILESNGLSERRAAYGVGEGYVQCVGCHSAVPDKTSVAFTDHWPWSVVLSSIENDGTEDVAVGDVPSFLSVGAETLLNQPWLGMSAFSKAHFNKSEKILITTYGERVTDIGGNVGYTGIIPNRDVLAWFDLTTDKSVAEPSGLTDDIAQERNLSVEEAFGEGFGFLGLNGETLSVASPDWSHDGSFIAYTAASMTQDGRISGGPEQTDVDIHRVPYNDGLGGTVSCIQGACDKNAAEYYPTFSADDKLLAFNREGDFRAVKTVTTPFDFPNDTITIDGSLEDVYYRPHSEIFIVPSEGGVPMRLAANDPPRCTGQISPGIINSRPRWSPDVEVSPAEFGDERSYYWVVFSSARSYPEQFILVPDKYSPVDTRASQLYIAAVVRNEKTGKYISYPAVYVWNQKKDTSNLTPTWYDFKIVAPSDNPSVVKK